MDEPVIMWRKDGTKLTGNYGTWKGREFELWSLKPYEGYLTLVQNGGDSPGPEWHTATFPNRFAKTPLTHSLDVPADEVTNRHSVEVTGNMGPGRNFVLIAEDDEGNLAVESIDPMAAQYKRQLINNHNFKPFSENEPLEHVFVGGWLPADRVRDIRVETIPYGTD
ncbi:hypothetical protein GCM10009636_31210 [Arthrobacter koreensis]|uniref:hypothetical protein n=1 Tax=Arthrobacter koreensis TaxID=199136 RepID=UPI00126593DC|nr:hypothetical protein [Arthrobacter koreensis]